MSDDTQSPRTAALDEFIIQLLAAGAVLSQMITHMTKVRASRRVGDLDVVPIPQIAHSVIRDVIERPMAGFTTSDLQRAAAALEITADELVDEILLVPISGGDPELN